MGEAPGSRREAVAEPVSYITACLKARNSFDDDDDVHTEAEILAMGEREGWWDGVL